MKTIQVSDETWMKLMKLRIDLNVKSNDEVLTRILKIVTKVELAEK